MNMFDLSGRVAIVTGGNQGIGFGIPRGLAGADATVVIANRRAAEGQKAAESLQKDGFRLAFKNISRDDQQQPKGNVDAELILNAIIRMNYYNKAIIVAGDGDYYCLAKYLKRRKKFLKLIAPARENTSSLLNPLAPDILYVSDWRRKLELRRHK